MKSPPPNSKATTTTNRETSTAVKVVGGVLLSMSAIRFFLPSSVPWLQSKWYDYLQWTAGNQPLMVFMGWLVFALTYWAVGLAFLFVDVFHQPQWIWRRKFQPKREFVVSGGLYNPSLKDTMINALANQLFVFLPGIFCLHYASTALGTGIDFSPALPSLWQVCKTSILAVILVELGFYYSHRLLHWKPLYRFHKTHHSYVTPIALSAIYSHPLEAFLSSTVSILGPAFLIGMHCSVFYLGVFLGWAITCRSHSGYGGVDNRISHDLHHSKNTGNYGLTGYLDRLHGTDIKI